MRISRPSVPAGNSRTGVCGAESSRAPNPRSSTVGWDCRAQGCCPFFGAPKLVPPTHPRPLRSRGGARFSRGTSHYSSTWSMRPKAHYRPLPQKRQNAHDCSRNGCVFGYSVKYANRKLKGFGEPRSAGRRARSGVGTLCAFVGFSSHRDCGYCPLSRPLGMRPSSRRPSLLGRPPRAFDSGLAFPVCNRARRARRRPAPSERTRTALEPVPERKGDAGDCGLRSAKLRAR
jgi:hypothetical protein